MSRSRRTAREAGTRFETSIATYLAQVLDDRIERRAKTGNKDRGDIGGVRAIAGVVVHKRRGTADAGDQYVTMTLDDLVSLLSPGWRP